MRKLYAALTCCVAMTMASSSFAGAESLLVGAIGQHPVPVAEAAGVPLFHCVKYKDRDEMAPCAVPKIVHVLDPCACGNSCGGCCGPQCVAVKICVPPCGCECVKVSKGGRRVRYDYGKYAVDVRVKDGYIEVDYQD